jgi:ribonuclease HII
MIYPDIKLEKDLWKKDFKIVVGIDEAGRGPLAGPVSAGAVVIHNEKQVVEIVRDSKKMTEKQRDEAYDLIKEKSTAYGIGMVDSKG